MTIEQAYDKLAEYVDGELSVEDRREIETVAATDPDFAQTIILCRTMNRALESQTELTPRVNFTVGVLKKCGIIEEAVETPRRRALRLLETWAPGLALGAGMLVGANALWDSVSVFFATIGSIIEQVTGLTVFSSHPFAVLGLMVPAVAVVVVGYALSDRWRYSR